MENWVKSRYSCEFKVKATRKREVHYYLQKEWQRRWKLGWKHNPECLHTKMFFPDLNLGKSRKLLFGGNSRKGYSIILQMITGTNHLAYHETKIGHMHDWTCRYCRKPSSKESSYHLLSECDTFAYVRFKTLQHPYPPPPYDYLSPGALLSFSREANIQWFPGDLDDS